MNASSIITNQSALHVPFYLDINIIHNATSREPARRHPICLYTPVYWPSPGHRGEGTSACAAARTICLRAEPVEGVRAKERAALEETHRSSPLWQCARKYGCS